jgi:hypothetical protein
VKDAFLELLSSWESSDIPARRIAAKEIKSKDALMAHCYISQAYNDLNAELERVLYSKKDKGEKPRCKAMVAKKYGKFEQCKRTSMHHWKYCYSHKNWDDYVNI